MENPLRQETTELRSPIKVRETADRQLADENLAQHHRIQELEAEAQQSEYNYRMLKGELLMAGNQLRQAVADLAAERETSRQLRLDLLAANWQHPNDRR